METKRDGERKYVRKVQEGTRRYGEHQASVIGRFEKLVEALETERTRLRKEVATLRDLLHDRDAEGARLHDEIAAIAEDNRRLSREYVEVERQSASIASLYVASLQLHVSPERESVLGAINEIVSGLIGCEEVAVYALEKAEARLQRIAGFGLDPALLRTVAVGSGIIGRTASTGLLYVRTGDQDAAAARDEGELTACVPLKIDGTVTGAIALFRLLSHKLDFEEADLELFDLLTTQAATALHCADLYEAAKAVPK